MIPDKEKDGSQNAGSLAI